jgi:hypothetical protein
MPCRNDGSIGPAVQGCRDDFDFTVTFENIILTIVPASAFLILGLGRLLLLRARRPIVNGRVFSLAKLVRYPCSGALISP